jgi:hypothetical protein
MKNKNLILCSLAGTDTWYRLTALAMPWINEHTCAELWSLPLLLPITESLTPFHICISGLESIHELSKGHLRGREEEREPSLVLMSFWAAPLGIPQHMTHGKMPFI